MSTKVKLVKKQSATQQPNEGKKSFVAQNVKVVKDDYVLDNTVGNEEEEVTTLENLRILEAAMVIDRRTIRSGLQRIEDNVGFANMTSTDKEAAARSFALSNFTNTYTQFPNVWDRIWNGFSDFHEPAVVSRTRRFRFASSIIYNTAIPTAANIIINRFITPITANSINLWTAYVEFGKQGTEYGDGGEYVMDYIHSTVGTSFELAGLREDLTGSLQPLPGMLTVDQIIESIDDALLRGILRTTL